MQRFLLILFLIGFTSSVGFGQKIIKKSDLPKPNQKKIINSTNASFDFLNFYGLKENYIPYPGSKEDFDKTIHISFHVWQKEDGTGNLNNTPENIERLKEIAGWLDGTYYKKNFKSESPLPYSTEYIEKPKLRVQLDGIYFYQDTTKDTSLYYCDGDYSHNVKLDNYIREHYPERLNSMPIHLVRGYYRTAWGYSHKGSIVTFSMANNVDLNATTIADWSYGQHWAHEIGHAFDLWHTYDSQAAWKQNCNSNYVDFLWDVYDTTQVKPCKERTSCDICLLPISKENNNIMGGRSPTFKSALQIGMMHRAAVMGNFYNVDFGVRDYITGYSEKPYKIRKDEVWEFSIKMYQDLIIPKGVTLTVKGEIQFVPEAQLIIQQGGTLIIDGGKLTNEKYYETTWEGIDVKRGLFGLSKNTGRLEIVNDGKIENAKRVNVSF